MVAVPDDVRNGLVQRQVIARQSESPDPIAAVRALMVPRTTGRYRASLGSIIVRAIPKTLLGRALTQEGHYGSVVVCWRASAKSRDRCYQFLACGGRGACRQMPRNR